MTIRPLTEAERKSIEAAYRRSTKHSRHITTEEYAARMRAGRTPFFRQRTGRGEWGTGIQRREAAIRSARTRMGTA